MKNNLDEIQLKLKVTFNNEALLAQALTHSSYVNENPGAISNERLEFLGDAVLGLIIGEKLYRDFPGYTEGQLTRLRAALIKKDTLAGIAIGLKLGNYLHMGKGEGASKGQTKPANLASTLEAVIGAIYLDSGLVSADEFITRLFTGEIEKYIKVGVVDYKSELQALLQSKYQQTPVYSTIEAKGPDHARRYTVEVQMEEKILGKGSGPSKQAAEMNAARQALEKLKDTFTQ